MLKKNSDLINIYTKGREIVLKKVTFMWHFGTKSNPNLVKKHHVSNDSNVIFLRPSAPTKSPFVTVTVLRYGTPKKLAKYLPNFFDRPIM